MRHATRLAPIALACVLVFSACSSGPDDAGQAKPPKAEPTSSKPVEKVKPLDAKAVEKVFITNLGGQPISSMCDRDKTHTHWACFYEGVESSGPYLRVNLSTDAGVDGDALADTAGRHWFNFVHCDFPALDIIIVSVNGLDHNVRRASTNTDSMPC